jgi:hypothetical protein
MGVVLGQEDLAQLEQICPADKVRATRQRQQQPLLHKQQLRVCTDTWGLYAERCTRFVQQRGSWSRPAQQTKVRTTRQQQQQQLHMCTGA